MAVERSALLAAPNLFSQVYTEARVNRLWSDESATCAATTAADEYGDAPIKTSGDLQAVFEEVLRTN